MKKSTIVYWSLTGLLSAAFLFSGIMYLTRSEELMNNFKTIGFPIGLVTFLGVAKFLGALALINPWFPTVKEWAYAGFTFVLLGAVVIHLATSTPFVAPLVFLTILALSYVMNKRRMTV